MRTSCSGWTYGRGRSRTPRITVNSAVFAPRASAIGSTTAATNAGERTNSRNASRNSRSSPFMRPAGGARTVPGLSGQPGTSDEPVVGFASQDREEKGSAGGGRREGLSSLEQALERGHHPRPGIDRAGVGRALALQLVVPDAEPRHLRPCRVELIGDPGGAIL